jgi:hypothetical protein
MTTWGSYGQSNGQFNLPHSIAVDGDGNIYVTDAFNDRVQKFTSTGVYLIQWGNSGSGDRQFDFPYGIAVDGIGNVFVADYYNDRVQKFTTSGAYIAEWGTSGSGDGQFNDPYGLATDVNDNIYVAENGNHRVQVFGAISKITVDIDIKPGDNPNTIHIENPKQIITVAILTTAEFNAANVDHTTVRFEGAPECHRDKKNDVVRRHEDDVDGDGDTDLVFHFRVGDTNLTRNSTEGKLEGQTYDGIFFEGVDAVQVIMKLKNKSII